MQCFKSCLQPVPYSFLDTVLDHILLSLILLSRICIMYMGRRQVWVSKSWAVFRSQCDPEHNPHILTNAGTHEHSPGSFLYLLFIRFFFCHVVQPPSVVASILASLRPVLPLQVDTRKYSWAALKEGFLSLLSGEEEDPHPDPVPDPS